MHARGCPRRACTLAAVLHVCVCTCMCVSECRTRTGWWPFWEDCLVTRACSPGILHAACAAFHYIQRREDTLHLLFCTRERKTLRAYLLFFRAGVTFNYATESVGERVIDMYFALRKGHLAVWMRFWGTWLLRELLHASNIIEFMNIVSSYLHLL